MVTPEDLKIDSLGPCQFRSPVKLSTVIGNGVANFIPEGAVMPLEVERSPDRPVCSDVCFEKAGPRQHIYFDPAETSAAIVTCGGLCPGLNNVIRSICLELHHHYHVKRILGIRYGYRGMASDRLLEPVEMTPEYVSEIHKLGGTVLGNSRGAVEPGEVVDFLRRRHVNVLFCIGGDGTQRGAVKIDLEARRQNYRLAVVGIPKTIDNDIQYVWRTFGFFTAIDEAREVINCAHVEATGAPNGVVVVKLMGRDAGFIAAGATVASQDVNFTLVPEVPFDLDGDRGLLNLIRERILSRGHAVVVAAEGAGQDLMQADEVRCDASGNRLHQDIGTFLQGRIKAFFEREQIPANVRYIDPSYIIRSIPANCEDALLCDQMGRNAVHAAMAGKTGVLIGYWYNVYIHVPIRLAIAEKKRMSPESDLWRGVLAATGQPARIGDPLPAEPDAAPACAVHA